MESQNRNLNNKSIEEYEAELVKRVEELSYIINGLENYGPFLKVIDMFKVTRRGIDDNWHLVTDPVKLSELRVTKFAVDTLITYIDNLKDDLTKVQEELAKIQNPNEIVNKDYDER